MCPDIVLPGLSNASPPSVLTDENFRTNVLLAWTMSNAGLAAIILQSSGGSTSVATTYMGVLL